MLTKLSQCLGTDCHTDKNHSEKKDNDTRRLKKIKSQKMDIKPQNEERPLEVCILEYNHLEWGRSRNTDGIIRA